MLTRVLLLAIFLALVWIALKRQVQRWLQRPEVQAVRGMAEEMRRAQQGARQQAAGGPRRERAVELAACAVCGVHTPKERLRSSPAHPGGGVCSQCLKGS